MRLLYLNFQFTTISLATQGISHHISFAKGVRNSHVVVGYCLEPSLLAEIQVWLSKQVLQALVIGVDLATISDEVMSPQLQCINYRCQFKVMLDSFLHEHATDESHKQSLCTLALGHSLILDDTRRNISRSPSEYQAEQALGVK